MGGVGVHLGVEELAHRRLVVDPEESAELRVGGLAVAPDQLVEADHVEAATVGGRERRAPRARPGRRRSAQNSIPEATSVGWWAFWRRETFDEPESRPSRTVCTKRASGKISASPSAAAIVKQLISTRTGLPA